MCKCIKLAFLSLGLLALPASAQNAWSTQNNNFPQQESEISIELTVEHNILVLPYRPGYPGTVSDEFEYSEYRERTTRSGTSGRHIEREAVQGNYHVNLDRWNGNRETVEFNIRWRASNGSACGLTREVIDVIEIPMTMTLSAGRDPLCEVELYIGRGLDDYIQPPSGDSPVTEPIDERERF